MTVFSRVGWIGALVLILLSSACNLPAQTPTATVVSILPTDQATSTLLPASTEGLETSTAAIPVTGMEEVSLQCQFCVNGQPHAVLILPESSSFLVSDPVIGVNCVTAQVVNERRILFCRGTQQTTFTFNVCTEDSNCYQYPITLANCPLSPRNAQAAPVILTPANAGISPTAPANTEIPLATQTVPSTLPAIATTAAPPQSTQILPPAATNTTPALPSTGSHTPPSREPRSTGLYDPEGFVRWYFDSVWNQRNYQDLWDNYLTPSFKARTNAGTFEEYVAWWSSVQRVDVNSVTVLENDGSRAWVRVNVTFTMQDGRVISNQEYDYDLFYDPVRQTWMFDYHV